MRAIVFASLAVLAASCSPAATPTKRLEKPNRPPELVGPRPIPTADTAFHSTAMSYEEALAVPEDMNAVKGERELSNKDLSAPMQPASVLDVCRVPEATRVTVKVAVREGKAMGVSVATKPDDAKVAECVDKAVRKLVWPASRKRDSFTTVF
jgi:hypothetical protein